MCIKDTFSSSRISEDLWEYMDSSSLGYMSSWPKPPSLSRSLFGLPALKSSSSLSSLNYWLILSCSLVPSLDLSSSRPSAESAALDSSWALLCICMDCKDYIDFMDCIVCLNCSSCDFNLCCSRSLDASIINCYSIIFLYYSSTFLCYSSNNLCYSRTLSSSSCFYCIAYFCYSSNNRYYSSIFCSSISRSS